VWLARPEPQLEVEEADGAPPLLRDAHKDKVGSEARDRAVHFGERRRRRCGACRYAMRGAAACEDACGAAGEGAGVGAQREATLGTHEAVRCARDAPIHALDQCGGLRGTAVLRHVCWCGGAGAET
jgi:hypothetical protein